MLIPVPPQLGYPVLAALIFGESTGLPLPGETALIATGGLVAAGHLALPLVVVVGATAAIAGDTLGYWLGRRGARRLLERDGLGAAHRRIALARTDRYFARFGIATVFAGRWIPGVRIVAAVAAGAARMPWRRFAIANATGAFAWATTISLLAAAAGPSGALLLAGAGLALAGAMSGLAMWRARRRTTARRAPLPASRG
jgi:membrane protein DedA with SNARE-associated domain